MAERGRLTAHGVMRTKRVVERVEARGLGDRPPTAAVAPVTGHPAIIRVTSATPTSDRYPGKLQVYDLTAKTYSDGADCWVVGPNGEALTTGKYHCRLMGILAADSKAVFIASGRVQGSGTLNTLPKWTPDGFTLGDSNVTDNGTIVFVGSQFGAASDVVTSGSTDALDVGDLSTVFLDCTDAITVIGGIIEGTEGRRLKIVNVSSNVLLLEHEEGTATAGNRLRLSEATDQLFVQNEGIDLVYGSDGSASRWRSTANVIQHEHDHGTKWVARADVTVANTTTETSVLSGTASGSATFNWSLGNVVRFHLAGYLSTATAPVTLTVRVKVGGTTHLTAVGAIAPTDVTNSSFTIDGSFTVRTDGSPGTLRGSLVTTGSLAFGSVVMQSDGNITTGSNAWAATAQWDEADAGNTVTVTEAWVEKLPTPQ